MAVLSIPAFHVSDSGKVRGYGEVFIQSRAGGAFTGVFTVELSVHFNPPADEYPVGSVNIKTNLNDGSQGEFVATSIDLINSHGRINPTIFLTGRCKDHIQPDANGCRFWLMIANNNVPTHPGTPDIVSFAVHDQFGALVAYGTGPLRSGDFNVSA